MDEWTKARIQLCGRFAVELAADELGPSLR